MAVARRNTRVLAGVALVLGAAVGGGLLACVMAMLFLGWAYSHPWLALKRWSLPSSVVAGLGVFLTFVAGSEQADPDIWNVPALTVPALALSAWVALPGVLSKDFADVVGDRLAGRRNLAVVHGTRLIGLVVTGAALLVGAGFVAAAWRWAPQDDISAICLGIFALMVAALGSSPDPRRREQTYTWFMRAQLLTIVSLLVVGIATH